MHESLGFKCSHGTFSQLDTCNDAVAFKRGAQEMTEVCNSSSLGGRVR